jgi:2-polyprenyl-3-methyl-5-hydroxy-6-metoxy-1,4-benzoquinol methylase
MKELNAINEVVTGNFQVLKTEKWLRFLALSEESKVNLEYVSRLTDLTKNETLNYVKRMLLILDNLETSSEVKDIVKEAVLWQEVSKTGSKTDRIKWLNLGINLDIHNIGSKQIYELEMKENSNDIISILIETHGLFGQVLRGETRQINNRKLLLLMDYYQLDKSFLREILICLNTVVIKAVNEALYLNVSPDIIQLIDLTLEYKLEGFDYIERLIRLRKKTQALGEDTNKDLSLILETEWLKQLFETHDFWYVEGALYDFSFNEFIEVLKHISDKLKNRSVTNISFEPLMRQIYIDYKNEKKTNIYKKRIIEQYIKEGIHNDNAHVSLSLEFKSDNDIVFVDFKFSEPAQKLIEFCELSVKNELVYEQAVIMLFDLFGFRKDVFDRFYNETTYLETMNGSTPNKQVILDYLVGKDILDVGPGGGALMDLIHEKDSNYNLYGIDLSETVVESLKKKFQIENKTFTLVKGDALYLEEVFNDKQFDTIIFSSILHEIYSYATYEGKKFNIDVIKRALMSAFDKLNTGGRIIIRDGIMTEGKNLMRIISFKTEAGVKFLNNYVKDFKGRPITIQKINDFDYLIPVNDAMEFLYTYTWGTESYSHEVNEQFGYFTPSEYKKTILDLFKDHAQIIEFKHYLQAGYEQHLNELVTLYDETYRIVNYPDSTCLIVIEKLK